MTLQGNGRAVVIMMLAMACFIFNDSFVKLVSSHLPLGQIMFLRSLIAMALLLGICLANGSIYHFGRLQHPLVVLRVVAEALATVFYLTALFHLPIANVTSILQALPLMITAGAAIFLGAPVGWRRWSAIGVGFFGVLVIVRPGLAGFDAWSLMALVGVVCMAVRDLGTSLLPKTIPTLGVTFAALAGVAVTGLAMAVGETWLMPSVMDIAFLAAAASFILVGYITLIHAMRTGDIAVVAPFRYSIILWAILIGYLVWGDIPDLYTLVGVAILVATGIYTLMRERKLMREAGPAASSPPLP